MRRLRRVFLTVLLCVPSLATAADKLTPAMLQGQWRVTKAEISPPGADTPGTWSVIRDLDLRADGRYVMHWGWRITPEPGVQSARSEGHWGWSAPGTVKLCGQNKIACNDIAACVMGTAQCLKVVAFGSDSMRLRMTGPGGAVMEYRLERRSGSSDFKGAGNDSSVRYVHDFSPEALREFKAASGIAITGLRPVYRTTLAVLRGARPARPRVRRVLSGLVLPLVSVPGKRRYATASDSVRAGQRDPPTASCQCAIHDRGRRMVARQAG